MGVSERVTSPLPPFKGGVNAGPRYAAGAATRLRVPKLLLWGTGMPEAEFRDFTRPLVSGERACPKLCSATSPDPSFPKLPALGTRAPEAPAWSPANS